MARGAITRVVFIISPRGELDASEFVFLVIANSEGIPARNNPFEPLANDDTRGRGSLYIGGLTYFEGINRPTPDPLKSRLPNYCLAPFLIRSTARIRSSRGRGAILSFQS